MSRSGARPHGERALAKGDPAQFDAPLTGFDTFEASAHSPLLEEKAAMNRILRDGVLAGKNTRGERVLSVR